MLLWAPARIMAGGTIGHQPLWTQQPLLLPCPVAPACCPLHLHQLFSSVPSVPSAGSQALSLTAVTSHRFPTRLPGERETRGTGSVQAAPLEPWTPGSRERLPPKGHQAFSHGSPGHQRPVFFPESDTSLRQTACLSARLTGG